MNKDNYITLIYKALKGEVGSVEEARLKAWIEDSEENRLLQQKIEQEWSLSGNYEPELGIDVEADFQKIQQRTRHYIAPLSIETKIHRMQSRRQWMGIAAGIVLALMAGWWLFDVETNTPSLPPIIDNRLIVQTSTGEKTMTFLADGSKVWLNEGSQLKYPKKFSSTQRLVYLEGEGFFEIEKNSDAPFVIETALASISVLGTSFNLNARPSTQKITVIVVTGKVKLDPNGDNGAIVLEVGEKGIFDAKIRTLEKSKNSHPNEYAWQSGVLRFKNQTLEQVIKEIGNLFGAEITIKDTAMQQCLFTGRLQEETLESALKTIADNFQMTIEQKGDTIFELSSGVCE